MAPNPATTDTSIAYFNHLLPEGEELFDYQHVGVAYALVQTLDGKGCFICDEQGLGKTRQAIVTCKAKGSKRILVIMKASLKLNWANEIARCAPEWDMQILKGTTPYQTTARVVLINFDILTAWADSLIADGFDAVIIDESHYVKSKGTVKSPVQRTVAALKLTADIRNRKGLVLLLSGTPFLNKPIELLPQLEMIGRLRDVTPKPYKGDSDAAWEKAFKANYCWDPETGTYNGSNNPNLLNLGMRGYGYVRRLRNEVLDLDDTHRIAVPLSLNGGLTRYFERERNFKPTKPQSYFIELMGMLRQEAGLAKIPAAVDWIKDFMEENPGRKLVVWAWHIPVQQGVAEALNKAGIKAIYWGGARNVAETEALKAEFNKGEAQVIVCSLLAHAFGHTLVGDGSNVTDSLFVEMPWHPGNVSQAEDRINRIGREAAAVFAHTLVAEGTIDEWLSDLIRDKWEAFKAGADGTVDEGEVDNIQRLMIEKLKRYMQDRYGIGPNGPGLGDVI